MGFLSQLQGDTESLKKNKLEYFQFFFQPSDGARIGAVKVNFLNNDQLKDSIKIMLQKFHYLKNIEERSLKFNNASFYDISEVHEVHEYLSTTDSSKREKLESEIAPIILNKILKHSESVYKEHIQKFQVKPTDNIASIASVLTDFDSLSDAQKLDTPAPLKVFSAWYANNMVNGYFLNELVSGNPEYYAKGTVDVVKRQSGV